jgi:pimeloyl-ACP methyl ester carboxylesterase
VSSSEKGLARVGRPVTVLARNLRMDLKVIDVPTLVMHGDDDQIVPIADFALLSVKLLMKATLKVYEKFPHGMCTTHADVINSHLLALLRAMTWLSAQRIVETIHK